MNNSSDCSFGTFRLDPVNAQLWRGDQEVTLRRKTFDVLHYLVDHPNQLITKAALLDAVWPNVSVSDSMPAVSIAELRKALGDEARAPRLIETLHGRGYRFIAKVTTGAPMGSASKLESMANGPKPIIVGREDEMTQLRGWWARALEGERRVAFVTGEAGIGKTAFVNAFLETVPGEEAVRVAWGQCVEQYGAGEPYMPVLEALTRLGQGAGGERVVELLDRFAPTWLAQMPALLTTEQSGRLQGQNQGVTQQRMLREMVLALEALAAEVPLVLVLGNLHWSDFSTLELISAVARRSEPARLIVICTHRPVAMLAHNHPLRVMKQELELHHYSEELQLPLLNEVDIADYLSMRFSSDGTRTFDGFAPVIHERSDGNPLFMINIVDYLIAGGLLSSSCGGSTTGPTEFVLPNPIEVPRNIRQMIERNFERLTSEEQVTLQAASVAGAEFSAAAAAAALERPPAEVETCCARLAHHEQFVTKKDPIVWPDGTIASGFRFQHSLYKEVLYGLIPLGRRAQLHKLIAAREEKGYGEGPGEIAAELAHHYEQGNDKAKAIHYFRLAGERAVARGAVVEAETHYRRAIELLSELPPTTERDRQELALQLAMGAVLWGSKSWAHPEASRAYTRAMEFAEKLGQTSQIVKIFTGLVISALGAGKFKKAYELAERMLIGIEHRADHASLCAAHILFGQTLLTQAQYLDAQSHFALGRAYYEKSNPGEVFLIGIDAAGLGAIVDLLLGFPERGGELLRQALHSLDSNNDPSAAGLAHFWAAEFCRLARETQGISEHARALRDLCNRQPVWAAFAEVFTTEALVGQGEWAAGAVCLRKALSLCKEIGHVGLLFTAKLAEAKILASQGRIDDALLVVSEIISDAKEYAYVRPSALLQRAKLLTQSNTDVSQIIEAYREAIDCARRQGAKYYELQATTSFALWLESQGRGSEALTMLAEIYGWFTEGFDTVALKEARALLDELNNKSADSTFSGARPDRKRRKPSAGRTVHKP